MTTMPAALPQNMGKLALYSALSVLAVLVVLTGFGKMPGTGSSRPDDGRYDPLIAPASLGGFPRWHGMVEGELADARQFARQYHARAIEATYLPPGMDPILATAVRARDEYRETGGTPYGKVLCNSAGVFVECYRAGDRLTVDVLAPMSMPSSDVARLVNEFWRVQTLPAAS
jgi:hypothetical protein